MYVHADNSVYCVVRNATNLTESAHKRIETTQNVRTCAIRSGDPTRRFTNTSFHKHELIRSGRLEIHHVGTNAEGVRKSDI